MSDASVLYAYWKKRIPLDLTPFTDPGTEVAIEGSGRTLSAEWISRDQKEMATFVISPDAGVKVSFSGKRMSYKSFMAGSEISDLFGLSKMILQASQDRIYIPTKAIIMDDNDREPKNAIELINTIVMEDVPSATRIIMATGDAGAGKTRVLQELVKHQAELYKTGQTSVLYLYVNAQGRALARLAEALATELQDLRAQLTYHGVAVLVRLGILVLVIDGFDELLGVNGYDDAFSSLSVFIEELDGMGQIIASARSTYYEEEFVSRAASESSLGGQIWMQVPIKVCDWTDDEYTSYIKHEIDKLGELDKSEELHCEIDKAFKGSNETLKSKPLFIAKAVELIIDGVRLEEGRDLLTQLVDAYIEREKSEKLLDRNERSLLTKEQIESLFLAIAEEMWNLETRELDRKSIRDIAEYVLFTHEIDKSIQKIVIERIPTLAFLTPGERHGSVTFEHEIFFSVFLAKVISEKLSGKDDVLRLLLGRSILPSEVSEIVIKEKSYEEEDEKSVVAEILSILNQVSAKEGFRAEQVKQNSGRIVASALKWVCGKTSAIYNLAIENVVFPGGDLKGVKLEEAKIENVYFRRTDLSQTEIVKSYATNTIFEEVILSTETTKLEIEGVEPSEHIYGIRVMKNGSVEKEYDPDVIREVLVQIGTIIGEAEEISRWEVTPEHFKLIKKFVGAYRRANPVCKANENLAGIFSHPDWKNIEKILINNKIVAFEDKVTGGSRKQFLRKLVNPEELLIGIDKSAKVDRSIKIFWEIMENKFNQ